MKELTYIAGGSTGLGQALYQKFNDKNHQVIEFSRSGTSEGHIACDFNQTAQSTETVQSTFQQHSSKALTQINLIINTATLAPFGSLGDADSETIKQHLNINITSLVSVIQAFIETHQNFSTTKTLTFISSGAARRAIPGLAMYSASKAFFERLIDTIAEEQKSVEYPIKCMVINPGVMDTGMQVEIRQQKAEDFPMVDMWQGLHQTGQLADPKDIADICYRLTVDEGENGGYYTAQDYL